MARNSFFRRSCSRNSWYRSACPARSPPGRRGRPRSTADPDRTSARTGRGPSDRAPTCGRAPSAAGSPAIRPWRRAEPRVDPAGSPRLDAAARCRRRAGGGTTRWLPLAMTRSMASRHQPHSIAVDRFACGATRRRLAGPGQTRFPPRHRRSPGSVNAGDVGEERNGEPRQLAGRRADSSTSRRARRSPAPETRIAGSPFRPRRAPNARRPARRAPCACRLACCASRYRSTKTLTLVRRISGTIGETMKSTAPERVALAPMRTSSP